MKELRSILRFWLEMIYCEFFPSFHSWKQTTKQFLSSKYKCRELLVFSFLVYCAGGRLNKQSSVKQIKYWSNNDRWHCFGLKYSSKILLSGRLSIRDFVSISQTLVSLLYYVVSYWLDRDVCSVGRVLLVLVLFLQSTLSGKNVSMYLL